MLLITHNGLPKNMVVELSKLNNVRLEIDNPMKQPNILIMYNTSPDEIRIRTSVFGKDHTDIIVLDNELSSLRRVSEFFEVGASLLYDTDVDPDSLILGIKSMVASNVYNYYMFGKHATYKQKLNEHVMFDENARTIIIGSDTIALNPKEFTILQLLCENREDGIDKKSVLMTVWGNTGRSASRSFDVYLNRLRHLFDSYDDINIVNGKTTTSGRHIFLQLNKTNI